MGQLMHATKICRSIDSNGSSIKLETMFHLIKASYLTEAPRLI